MEVLDKTKTRVCMSGTLPEEIEGKPCLGTLHAYGSERVWYRALFKTDVNQYVVFDYTTEPKLPDTIVGWLIGYLDLDGVLTRHPEFNPILEEEN